MKVWLACTAALAVFGVAWSVPIVSYGDGKSKTWTEGTTSGSIYPTCSFATAGMMFYGDLVATTGEDGFACSPSTLTPDFPVSDSTPTTFDSLVMSWDDGPDPDVYSVAEWEFMYDDDPNLVGTTINFNVFAPHGVKALGIELIDVNGFSRGWFTRNIVNFWQPYTINPVLPSAVGMTYFFNEPGFDLTQVMFIRFDEATLPSDPIILPDPTHNGQEWNAWGYFEVVPEPSSLALVAGSICLIALHRRNRR